MNSTQSLNQILISLKISESLTKTYSKTVASVVLLVLQDNYDNIDDIIDDLNDGWESSFIVEEIGDGINFSDIGGRQKLFNKLRDLILFGDKPCLDHLNFNITQQDIENAKKRMTLYDSDKYCQPIRVTKKAFWDMIAVEFKNEDEYEISILLLLHSLYCYWCSKSKLKQDKFTIPDWIKSSTYLSTIRYKNNNFLLTFQKDYNSPNFMTRLLSDPMPFYDLFFLTNKIKDSYSEYVQIVVCVNKMINKFLKTNKQYLPLQIDLCIIPKNIRKYHCKNDPPGFTDSDSNYDSDPGSDYDLDLCRPVMPEILELFQQQNINYLKADIDFNNELQCIHIMKEFVDKLLSKNKQSKRIIFMIDKANLNMNINTLFLVSGFVSKYIKTISNDLCDLINEYCGTMKYDDYNYNFGKPYIYAFQAPLSFNISDNNFSEMNCVMNTQEYAMPKRQSGFGPQNVKKPKVIYFNFQMHSITKIIMYFWYELIGLRFWPQNLFDILPSKFFNNCVDYSGLNKDDILKEFGEQYKDKWFDDWNKQINSSLFVGSDNN